MINAKRIIVFLFLFSGIIFSQEVKDTTEKQDTSSFVASTKGLENLVTISAIAGGGFNNAFVTGFGLKAGGNFIEDAWDIYLGGVFASHLGKEVKSNSKDSIKTSVRNIDSTAKLKSMYYGFEVGYSFIKNQKEVIRPYLGIGMVSIENKYTTIKTIAGQDPVINAGTKKDNAVYFNPGIYLQYNLDDLINQSVSIGLDLNYKVIGGDFNGGCGFAYLALTYRFGV